MNAKNPNDEVTRLGALLREWKTDSALPTRFQEKVWRRITHAEPAVKESWWTDLWRSTEAAFRRPALAVAYVAVLMMVGLSAGLLRAHEKATRVDYTLQARYLQVIDPFQKPR